MNHTLVCAAQIQILQPDQIALVLSPPDDGFGIGDARENRGDETGRAHAGVVEYLHGGDPAFNAYGAVHLPAEFLIQRVDAPGNAGIGECFDEIEVAHTRSDFVAILILQPDPCICSSSFLVRLCVSSSG
jgi:hypothetical protein